MENNRRWKFLVVIFTMTEIVSFGPASATLATKPKNTEAKVGDTISFNCSTTVKGEQIEWLQYHVGATSSQDKTVFSGGRLLPPYSTNGRFQLERNESQNAFNLVISRVALEDAGRYVCQENAGEFAEAQLVIIEANPKCISNIKSDAVVGPNSCGIKEDLLQLSCSVPYRGNIPPVTKWTKVRSNETIVEGVTNKTSNNIVTSNLTTSVDLRSNGSAYMCHAVATNYSCTLDFINVLYAFGSQSSKKTFVNEKVICVANTTQPCTYNWKWVDGVQTIKVSGNQTLIANKSGWHVCEANCTIKEKACRIVVMLVHVNETQSSTGFQEGYIALIVILVVAVCSLVLILVCIGIRHSKKKKVPTATLR